MTQSGGCQCGAVRYTIAGEPTHSSACWCKDCRAAAGATPVVWTLFRQDEVAITGAPVSYESSPATYRQFCGTCGTGLFFYNEAIFPGQVDIQAATLDDPDAWPPQAHIQLADAPGWRARLDALPRFDRFPALPE